MLVDTWATLETHSIFFDHIQNMGGKNHTLEYKLIAGNANDKVEIQAYQKYFYDNIILMAPTVSSYGKDLLIKDILEFVDFHHNIMAFDICILYFFISMFIQRHQITFIKWDVVK